MKNIGLGSKRVVNMGAVIQTDDDIAAIAELKLNAFFGGEVDFASVAV
jgi:hypothetical protein